MIKTEKATFGLDRHVANAGCYLLLWVSGLIFFLAEKKDSEIRFNALQSIIFFGGLTIIGMIPILGQLLAPFLSLAGLVAWIFLLVKTYQGEQVVLPVIGEYAKKYSK